MRCFPQPPPLALHLVATTLVFGAACGGGRLTPSRPQQPSVSPIGAAIAGVGGAAAHGPVAGAMSALPSGPSTLAPVGGVGANALPGTSGAAGASGQGELPPHMRDECLDAAPVAAEDAMITSAYEQWMSPSGRVELVLPKPVQAWMDSRLFKEGHDGWHAVRRCMFLGGGNGGAAPPTTRPGRGGSGLPRGGAGMSGSAGSSGSAMPMPSEGAGGITLSPAFALCKKAELAPAEQECVGTKDGYEFLVAHRHMIQYLRQSFPAHPDLFAGFPKFPFDAQNVPEPWRDRFGNGWSKQVLRDAMMLEDIEHNLDRFPTEGALGQYIQCGAMATGGSSVHGALHFKWVVNGSPYNLGDTTANLGNYMFWKLHGWIDMIWGRYRAAKGLKDDDAQYLDALAGQCREMHTLGSMIGHTKAPTSGAQPLPKEAGFFHEQVRPILEDNCAGCHSGGSPEGGMVLGGSVSSAAIVGNLVNVKTSRGGQFKRITPSDPQQSWLYLKASGMAAMAGCTGTCNSQVMPPTGMVTLTQTQLDTIRRWIMDGAAAPTTP